MAREMEGRPRTWASEIVIAFAYLGIKDTARALDGLERATALHAIWPSYATLCYSEFDVCVIESALRRVGASRPPRRAEVHVAASMPRPRDLKKHTVATVSSPRRVSLRRETPVAFEDRCAACRRGEALAAAEAW
jgi:hypothetical protein